MYYVQVDTVMFSKVRFQKYIFQIYCAILKDGQNFGQKTEGEIYIFVPHLEQAA